MPSSMKTEGVSAEPSLSDLAATSAPPIACAAFTPGPWFIECDGLPELRNVSTYITAGSGSDHVLIAEINTDAPDARLIAAAPELYEALRFYVEAEDTGLENDELDRFARLARHALAKAEGR
jgi:hypothetical protein